MHADRSGVQNGVKERRAQSAARNDFCSNCTCQCTRSFFTSRANAHYRAGPSQRKCRGPRRPSRSEDQHAAALDAEFFLERAQHANIIRVATVERTITPHHNGIHGADFRGERLTFLQVFENALLVRQRHAETPDSKFRNRLQEIRQLMNEEWQIDSINFARHKPRVMQQRR